MCEAILIAVYDNTTRVDVEGKRGNSSAPSGYRVVIIIGVLHQLENEARAAIVKVLGQSSGVCQK